MSATPLSRASPRNAPTQLDHPEFAPQTRSANEVCACNAPAQLDHPEFASQTRSANEVCARNAPTQSAGRVVIIAGIAHANHIKKECAALSDEEKKRVVFIPEPCAKNTAAAIACAATYCSFAGKNRTMLVLTSDHIIEPIDVFVKQASDLAKAVQKKTLAVFGIKPRSAETGYGYIEAQNSGADTKDEINSGAGAIASVISFHEKPDKNTAQRYLEAGNFYWNSGMFAFTADFIINEFKKNCPSVLAPFEALSAPDAPHSSVLEHWPGLKEAYDAAPNISFDYAIAEKCADVIMAKADFDWIDVGSWDEYAKLETQKNSRSDNVGIFSADSSNNFVSSDIPVALCGCENLIVVIKSGKDGAPPVALIAKKGETQKIRDIVDQLKSSGRNDLL